MALLGSSAPYDLTVSERSPELVVIGSVLQAPTAHRLEVLADVAIVVGAQGTISAIHPADSEAAHSAAGAAGQFIRLGRSQRMLPGMIDTHIHAPQWPQLGTGLDIPLERWLFEYTFPLEIGRAHV